MAHSLTTKAGKVLIVDDNILVRQAIDMALSDDFEVLLAESGEACLQWVDDFKPDMVFVDIEMEGIDGFETCVRLRHQHDMPIVFISSHDSLEERLRAYDSGGDDFIVKPFDAEELHRKALKLVAHHTRHQCLAEERNAAQLTAMSFLRSVGETGILLNFMRNTLNCVDYEALASRLVEATKEYGVDCHVQIRYTGGLTTMTANGPASPLESSILEQSATLGRIFQFKNRLLINYPYVSVMIMDFPADEDIGGRLRDNIAILAESVEAIAETVGVRKESAARAEAMQEGAMSSYSAVENLRTMYRQQQVDTRCLLNVLTDKVEDIYVFLGLTENQETAVSDVIRQGATEVLELFAISEEFEAQFSTILDGLSRNNKSQAAEVW